MKKVIVTGGRDYEDFAMLCDILEFINPDVIIQGGARGADSMARDWAKFSQKEIVTFNADWDKHGKAAGPIRNAEMLDSHRDALVIAFPGGRGTESCIKLALERNMIVLKVFE